MKILKTKHIENLGKDTLRKKIVNGKQKVGKPGQIAGKAKGLRGEALFVLAFFGYFFGRCKKVTTLKYREISSIPCCCELQNPFL